VKAHIGTAIKAHLIRGAFLLLLMIAVCVVPFALGQWQTRGPSLKKNPTIVCNQDWQAGPDMPVPLIRAVGVYFQADGNFYTMGGRTSDSAGSDFQHVLQYNPTSNAWIQMGVTLPDNQMNNMACGVLAVSGTPFIYCVGGSAAGQTTAAARLFFYDPVTDTATTLTAADNWPGNILGTILPGGFAVANNKLYILGGFNINVASTNEIWEFDPNAAVSSRWTQKTNTPEGIMYAPTCTIGNIIYVAGASDFQGGTVVDTTNSFSFDPVANTIGTIAPIPRSTGETRALNFNGLMLVMGGGGVPPNPSSEVDIYDPGTNTWTTGSPVPSPMTARRNFPTDTDGTTRIWLAGGYVPPPISANSMEIFCAAAASPTPTSTPCSVTSPACGIVVTTPPTDFIVDVTDPVDPATLDASDLTVNGTPADNVILLNGNMTISFIFNASPAVQGLNTMHIPAGAFDCGGGPVSEFTCTFRYRVLPTPRPRPTPVPRGAPPPPL
jgi:hypothetical protein